jgi:hypothetical protein
MGDNSAIDHYNRRLEKSIGRYDQTHNFKTAYIWEMPFGPGRRFLHSGIVSRVIGGWRIAAFHYYTSGTPLELTNDNTYNIFNGRADKSIQLHDVHGDLNIS